MTYIVHCLMEFSCRNWFTILPKNRSVSAYINREYPNKGFKAPEPLIYREGNIASKTAGNREHCLKNSREQGTLDPPYPSPMNAQKWRSQNSIFSSSHSSPFLIYRTNTHLQKRIDYNIRVQFIVDVYAFFYKSNLRQAWAPAVA